MQMTFSSFGEQLFYEVNTLKRFSREAEFSQYLDSVIQRAGAAPELQGELRKEVIRNYMIYADRRRAAGEQMPASFMECIYPGMEPPVILERTQIQQPVQPQQTMPQVQGVPVQQQQFQQQVAQPQQPMSQVQGVPVQQAVQQQAAQIQQPVQPQQVNMVRPVQPASRETTPKKPGAEYAVGGVVLSILGTMLILTGFIMLAVNFFDSFWQGMTLYAVCGVLIAISELLIKRLVKKLSFVFTSLGIAGLFVVTLVNHYALHMFNFWIAMVLVLVFSALTVTFARFKKELLFNIIGYVSVYVSFGLIASIDSPAKLYSLFGLVLLQSALWIFLPADNYTFVFSIINSFGTFIYLMATIFVWNSAGEAGEGFVNSHPVRIIFIAASFIVLLLGYTISGIRIYSENSRISENGRKNNHAFATSLFLTSTVLHVFVNQYYYGRLYDNLRKNMTASFSVLAFLLLGGAAVWFLWKKKSELWQFVLYSITFASFLCLQNITAKPITAAGMAVLLIASALLCRFIGHPGLRILDMMLKVLYSIVGIYIASQNGTGAENFILIFGFVATIAIGSGFLIPSHIILTGALIYCTCRLGTYKLWLILISGILMLAVFVYHNVKWLKHKRILVFDIFALATLVIVLGFLNHSFYSHDMITQLIVFCFGLAIIVQYLQKSYGMFFAGNMMPIAMYLSYYVLVLRIKDGFVTSAILMGVALVCVTLGFLMKQKAIRIYGLVLSMFVCLKLVFFDFAGAASLVKTIMYFVVGIIALTIAGVYIVMEMKLNKKSNDEN